MTCKDLSVAVGVILRGMKSFVGATIFLVSDLKRRARG